ncbi:MAG: hypothetical protein HDQ89_02465 [Desulfovibrio sp.]|nr:hypothetical protein [Desulfovibrio sp.]
MSVLRTGKWVCEEKGIPTDKLIAACNSGKLTAYSPESGQKILASSQCRKKFFFVDKLYFSLSKGRYPSYIRLNKDDLYNFNIYLGKLRVNYGKYDGDESLNTSNSNTDESDAKRLSIIGYHVLQEVYYNNECYLFFFKLNCDHSKTSDIYKNIDCLYQINEIIFAPKRDGHLILRFLDLELHPHREHISKANISIKEIKYEGNKKFILDKNNDDSILIYHNGLQCIPCTASPLRINNENRHFFSEAYQKCRRYFHQYKLNYFRPDDGQLEKPLQLKTDFFIFDYKEYCQQAFLQENEESKRYFYEYIRILLFDINEIENIFIDSLCDIKMQIDPLLNIKDICLSLLEKYDGSEEEEIIRAYLRAITTNKTYHQLHDEFFPHRKKVNKKGNELDNRNKAIYFYKFLCKFKDIAEKNGLKFIPIKDLRRIGEFEVREKVKKSLKEKP